MAKLVIENGPDKGLEFSLTGGEHFTVGRDSAATLQIKDSLASRHHFRIEIRDGECYLCDDGSTNGTYLNGKRVSEIKVEIGDRIRVGETLISILGDDVGDATGGLIGVNLGGYRLDRRIGRGGMGTVYLATQLSLDRPVAIKILSDDLARNEKFIEMFQDEARAAAKLQHPNIVLAYDVGEAAGKHYFAMEYVPGGSVQDRLAECRRLPVAEAIGYVIEAARALEFAEQKGIVHRDIKPDNMMVTENGGIKICDLGLARSFSESDEGRRSEGIAGSPHYIAPEQARSTRVDHRADIYSLGASFYRMLAGKTPFSGSSVKELIKKHITDTPENLCELNPAVPQIVAHIVDRMMAKNPDARYQSAREIIEDLEPLRGMDFDSEPVDTTGKTILMTDTPMDAPLVLEEDSPPPEQKDEPVLPVDDSVPASDAAEVVGGYVPPAHRPFPKKVVWILVGVIVLAVITAGVVYSVLQHLESQKWREEVAEIEQALSLDSGTAFTAKIDALPSDSTVFDNLKAALDIADQIEREYPDNEDARAWARKTRSTIEKALIERAEGSMSLDAAIAMRDCVASLFAADSECVKKYEGLVARKKSQQTRSEKIARIKALLHDAEAAKLKDQQDIASIPIVYKEYKTLFDEIEQYEPSVLDGFRREIAEARKSYKDYSDYYAEWGRRSGFQPKLDTILERIANKQYVEARETLRSVRSEYPVLWGRYDKCYRYNEDAIETAAKDRYSDTILPKVNETIGNSKFDPKERKYDRFAIALKILEDFRRQYYGEPGEEDNSAHKEIGEMIASLRGRIEAFEKARREIQGMIERSQWDKARAAAADLPGRFENASLKTLAEKVGAEVDAAEQEAENNVVRTKFAAVEKKVREKILVFEFAEARKALDAVDDAEAAILGEEYKALVKELDAAAGAQREIIKQLNATVRLEKVYIDNSGREVESVTEEGVKVVGRTDSKAWQDLAPGEFWALYDALKTPTDEDMLRFLAGVCLRKADDIRGFKLGFKFMQTLSSNGVRHTEEYRQYREALAAKGKAAYAALVKKISDPGTPKEEADRLTEEALALRKFLYDDLKQKDLQ